MNILHIVGTLNTGGIQKFILQLSQSSSLKKYKHQVLCTIQSIDNVNITAEVTLEVTNIEDVNQGNNWIVSIFLATMGMIGIVYFIYQRRIQ